MSLVCLYNLFTTLFTNSKWFPMELLRSFHFASILDVVVLQLNQMSFNVQLCFKNQIFRGAVILANVCKFFIKYLYMSMYVSMNVSRWKWFQFEPRQKIPTPTHGTTIKPNRKEKHLLQTRSDRPEPERSILQLDIRTLNLTVNFTLLRYLTNIIVSIYYQNYCYNYYYFYNNNNCIQ